MIFLARCILVLYLGLSTDHNCYRLGCDLCDQTFQNFADRQTRPKMEHGIQEGTNPLRDAVTVGLFPCRLRPLSY